ncbi:MAG: Gfo/Idh/MocA family protein [Nocardioidaceae bacterium]
MADPSTNPIRWGILATGKIAHAFAADLALLPDAHLVAVGSRTMTSARTFADEYAADRAYSSYADLAADPDVDIVYVATPHALHLDNVLTCFEAGKAVLCEKALALTTADARRLVQEARARGLFFCEAMWMRTNPTIRKLVGLVRSGRCGQIRQVRADLGFLAPADPASRLWDPALGASALLDVGIYPLTFAHLVLGPPSGVRAAAVLSDGGVDVNGGATLTYDSGAVASISWTQTAWSDNAASIAGDRGRIEVAAGMHEPPSFDYVDGEGRETFTEPVIGRGYAHEAAEAMRCLRAGEIESPLIPLDETVDIMALMDEIRSQVGAASPPGQGG